MYDFKFADYIHLGALGLAALMVIPIVFVLLDMIFSEQNTIEVKVETLFTCFKAMCLLLILAGVWR